MGITTFKMFIFGRYVVRYTGGNHALWLGSWVAVKLNFPSFMIHLPKFNFEYDNPLIYPSQTQAAKAYLLTVVMSSNFVLNVSEYLL